jgi:dTDP-4-amino-4,6-dideoxygalactose transaminase
MNDFRRRPEPEVVAELAAIERVVRSGWFILGREVEAFERAWAARCGVGHAIGVGNGLDAIEIGLRALGIGAGDEVITTAMTAFATVLAIRRAGAEPVIADIDPRDGQISLESAARCVGQRTRACLVVHLYGGACDLDRWTAFARERGILLLEDCAQAHGARWNGRPVGSVGAFGAFSFYPTKNLGAIGDGGALVTADAALAAQARQLRNYGQSDRYTHPASGLNSRLDEVQAAVLGLRLGYLDASNRRRAEVAAAYRQRLRNPRVELLDAPRRADEHVHHLFVVRCEQRARLAAHLAARGITTISHYPVAAHRQPAAAGMRCDPAGLPHAERHAATCLSLPCHPHLDDADVDRVVAAIDDFA